MQNKPLLSICIPTYNREKYLQECLDSIVQQDGFNVDEIEIIISDNASQDNTEQLVRVYSKKYPNIRYYKNQENIGAIRNVLLLPDLAQGEYVWYMSDDDMFSDIAFSTVLPILRIGSVDFLLSKFYGFWNGQTIEIDKIQRTGNIHSFTGMSHFFEFIGKISYDITPYLMLLSIFCFRRDIFQSHLKRLLKEKGENYIDTLYLDNFIHSRIIYTPFGEKKNIIVVERDLVLCRGDNISWSFHFVVCEDLRRLIQDLKNIYHINNRIYRKMKNIYYYAIFSYIIMVHVKKYLPKWLYDFCVQIGRKIFSYMRYIRMKFSSH